MTEAQSNIPRARNDDFIRTIKDKYSSANKVGRISPNKYLQPSSNNNDRSLEKHKQPSKQNATPLQNKNNNEPFSRRAEEVYSNLKDYQTLRHKYEEREFKQNSYNWEAANQKASNQENERENLLYKIEPQRKGVDSTNRSSPIKKFYDSVQKKSDNFLNIRKNEIEQMHLQRATQHKIQRQKTQKAIASIDYLLDSIRKTLSSQKQLSR